MIGSSSRSVGRVWEDMEGYTTMMNNTNCLDQCMLGKSAWGTTEIEWNYESSARVREEPHKLHGPVKAWQECVRPRAGKDGGGILYNAMMSIYSRVSQIYTPSCWVPLLHPCITVCTYIERPRYHMPCYDVANLVTVTKTNMMNKMPCDCGTGSTAAVRIWYQVSRRFYAEVPAALEISCRPGLRSQVLSKFPADLRRGLSSSKIRLPL